MTTTTVTMVRVYLTERKGVNDLLSYLHDQSQVRGVTVFRGITGFGKSGHVHSSALLDLSMDLPVVIEFFDLPERVAMILKQLNTRIEPGHIVCWAAEINQPD
jgi:PII-like signaling protein